MAPIGLREQTVKGANSIADARARHRWNIPGDYNVAIDCIDRHTDLRDKPALFYEDDERRRSGLPTPCRSTRRSAFLGWACRRQRRVGAE